MLPFDVFSLAEGEHDFCPSLSVIEISQEVFLHCFFLDSRKNGKILMT